MPIEETVFGPDNGVRFRGIFTKFVSKQNFIKIAGDVSRVAEIAYGDNTYSASYEKDGETFIITFGEECITSPYIFTLSARIQKAIPDTALIWSFYTKAVFQAKDDEWLENPSLIDFEGMLIGETHTSFTEKEIEDHFFIMLMGALKPVGASTGG